jgi:hypothetical protein
MAKTIAADAIALDTKVFKDRNDLEMARRGSLYDFMKSAPIPPQELLSNLPLFLPNKEIARMLFVHEMYRMILNVHGSIMEFGVRWGANQALFSAFRGIYEPYNANRRIIGFDTFEGFPSVAVEDGKEQYVEVGAFAVTPKYEHFLNQLLQTRLKEGASLPPDSIELVKGDASVTVPKYLEQHQETVIALAYFDFDLYKPTKDCLLAIKPYLTKGSVVVFDELNFAGFPGETQALREVMGLDRYPLRHLSTSSARAYMVID